jgi:hypothetical protein
MSLGPPGTRRKSSRTVSVEGFKATRQELDAHQSEPHSQTALSFVTFNRVQIPKGVNAVLVQVTDQNARYTITKASTPTPTSGFRLTAGNDPIAIPVDPEHTDLVFQAETAGAILEMQFGNI